LIPKPRPERGNGLKKSSLRPNPRLHNSGCSCWCCIAGVLGAWIDVLGLRTSAGAWILFVTMTYRTIAYPWNRGFPGSGSGKPSPEFAHHVFADLVTHLEQVLGERIDYVVADQLGSLNGRFHQHALLAGKGLDQYPRSRIAGWLNRRAGFARVLPFEQPAAYYLSRYIGRGLERTDWDLRIGDEKVPAKKDGSTPGHSVIATSAEMPKGMFHQGLPGRRR
jgi:hypothetical protein